MRIANFMLQVSRDTIGRSMSEKIAGFLDTPNPDRVEERLRSLGADVGFLRWLYNWHCPTYIEDTIIPLVEPKRRYREWKKLRRRLTRAKIPPEEIRERFRQMRKDRGELHQRRTTTGLHEIVTIGRRKRGRPRKQGLWAFVWLAKAYMERVTKAGSPSWSVLAQMVREWGSESYGAGALRIGWEKNKSHVQRPIEWNVEAFLYGYIRFYSQRLKSAHSRKFLNRTLGALDRYAASRVRKLHAQGYSPEQIGEETGLTEAAIKRVLAGKEIRAS